MRWRRVESWGRHIDRGRVCNSLCSTSWNPITMMPSVGWSNEADLKTSGEITDLQIHKHSKVTVNTFSRYHK